MTETADTKNQGADEAPSPQDEEQGKTGIVEGAPVESQFPAYAQTIHQRMAAILAELPAIGKDSVNPEQHFQYRSHDDVLNAVNPLLAKYGVYVVPEVLERIAATRETTRGKIMYEVNLLVRYSFIAEDGSWIAASAWGEGTDMGDKSTNKAMTMAFKNVLAQAFAVSTQEGQSYDADGSTAEETVAAGTAAREAAAQEAERQRRQAEEERPQRLRGRIGELCGALDVQTGSDPGTWLALVKDATLLQFEVEYDKAPPDTLEEVGKTLKAIQEGGITEAPEQLDLTTPF